MKILVFVGVFPKLSQTFILNEITGLLDAGHEVVIMAKRGEPGTIVHEDVRTYHLMDRVIYYGDNRRDSKISKAFEFARGLAAECVPGRKKAASIPVSVLLRYPNLILLARKLRSVDLSDVDVVHAHFGPNGVLALQCMKFGLLSGRLFTTFHGYDMLRYVKQRGEHAYRELFASDSTLLPISRFWEQRLIRLGARPRQIVVHHMGIDVEKFDYCPALPDQELRLVSAARFVEKKGLEYGIRAVGRLIDRGVPVRYTIIGGGPLDERLKQLAAESGHADRIVFSGWKTQDELIKVMKQAHVVLLPSVTAGDGDMEGIPVQLMEAMAMGKIVVSTRHSGIPELIDHRRNGFLTGEKDVDELTQMLFQVYTSPEKWPEISKQARQTIVERFNIHILNEQLIDRFQEQTRGLTDPQKGS